MAQTEETVGDRLKRYRKLSGYSAQDVADRSGLTRSVITNIENNRRTDVSFSELVALSSAISVPVAALVYPVDRPFDQVIVGRFSMPVALAVRALVGQLSGMFGGPAGYRAVDLLTGIRQLETSRNRLRTTRQDIYEIVRLFDLCDALGVALDQPGVADSPIADAVVQQADAIPGSVPRLRALLQQHDLEMQRYLEVADRFRALGGDPGKLTPAVIEWDIDG